MTLVTEAITPTDKHALVVTLLDPLGRKGGYTGRTVQIPSWADGEALTVVGPPDPYKALVILHGPGAVFSHVSGKVEFRRI